MRHSFFLSPSSFKGEKKITRKLILKQRVYKKNLSFLLILLPFAQTFVSKLSKTVHKKISLKSLKISKSEHIQPLSSCTMFSKKQIERAACIAKIFEQTHSPSQDILKIVNIFYTSFYGNLKQRNQT